MKHLLTAFVAFWVLLGVGVQAAPIVSSQEVAIGKQTLIVGFSEYPPKAERSIDLTFGLKNGIQKSDGAFYTGSFRLRQPDGKPYWDSQILPRFPRDRSLWGLDSIALPTEGKWTLEVRVLGVGSGLVPIVVEKRPEGPPNNLIYALSSLPIVAMLVLGWRAWRRVRPLRHSEAKSW
jgi:hypothetical protein